jgi:hypothetical protein
VRMVRDRSWFLFGEEGGARGGTRWSIFWSFELLALDHSTEWRVEHYNVGCGKTLNADQSLALLVASCREWFLEKAGHGARIAIQ